MNISLHRVLSTLRRPGVINTVPLDRPWQVVTLIAGSKRRSLLMAGDDSGLIFKASMRHLFWPVCPGPN